MAVAFSVFSYYFESCCQLLSVTFLMKRKHDSRSFCFGPWQTIPSCISLEQGSGHLTSCLSFIKTCAFCTKKSLNACFPCIKTSTDLSMFFCKIVRYETGLYSLSCLCVIAWAQIGVIYACLWNNQSCLSRALEPPGSESFCNEFWFAKSLSNLLPQFCTNIKTNSLPFCATSC